MKNITQVLQKSISKADPDIRENLLNFVNANSQGFEAAQDAAAIEAILNDAVSANSITQEGKSFLLNAIQNDLSTNPSAPDKTKTKSDGGLVDKTRICFFTLTGLLWLLTLYLAATWLAVGSLSSIQFRDDIENKYNTTLNETLKLKDLQADADQYRSSMKVKVSGWESELGELAAIIGGDPHTLLGDKESYKKMCESEQRSEDVIVACNRLSKVLPSLRYYKENMEIKDKLIAEAFIKSKDEVNKNNTENANNPEKKPNDLEARIGFMLKFNFGDMLRMPVQVLTLLLVIAMGVLGSTITMTWTFLSENTSLPPRWYLLRPFVGALSALVIFIFAKAGQMSLITDAASASLSPFMLSLLGIAAGLLSDRAYSQMASVSGRFLGNMGAEQERWSSHLKAELDKQNMTPEALATALNLDKHRTEEIITGARKATLLEQQRISDRLGVAPRLLFTDIPPQ